MVNSLFVDKANLEFWLPFFSSFLETDFLRAAHPGPPHRIVKATIGNPDEWPFIRVKNFLRLGLSIDLILHTMKVRSPRNSKVVRKVDFAL